MLLWNYRIILKKGLLKEQKIISSNIKLNVWKYLKKLNNLRIILAQSKENNNFSNLNKKSMIF